MSVTKYESQLREPLVNGNKTYGQVTHDIVHTIEAKPTRLWYIGFYISVALLMFGAYSVYREVVYGIGQWNVNRTIGWGWDITNFVWWVGIGHATLPYPNTRGPLWPNFNSPLLWDVFAISTYFTVSLLFWYSGLLPDFATIRDRAKTKLRKRLYGLASFGWSGSTKHWQRHESLSLVLAGLSTPLVLSVHTIVSFDFATSVVPGWHTTIFPPYFVAGAIFSGFAMVQTLMLILRKVMGLEDYITLGHIEAMNKVIVLTGSIVGCAYLTELFMAWYSQVPFEQDIFFKYRIAGPYGWSYWLMMTCNVISPQLFWSRKLRRNVLFTFIMSIVVNIGMWFERFVIIVSSLYRDYLPSSWSIYYRPTIWEIGFYVGTFGLFFTCFFLFAKYFPVIAIAEIKYVLKTNGESFKNEMTELESKNVDEFVHEMHHDHHEEGTVKVAHH